MLPHPARSALARLGPDLDRLFRHRPQLAYLPHHVEHPGPQLVGIVDLVSRVLRSTDRAGSTAHDPAFFCLCQSQKFV
jgi:hypothetical protein